MKQVFLKGFVAQQLAGKFIPEHFFCARQLSGSASPDVTSQRVIYASTALHVLHVSVWKGKYGSWLTLVNLEVSQICDHFNVIISECLPHDRFLTHLRAILESKETNIFNRLFSFVIGRPFDHVFEFQLRTHCLLFI